MWLSQRIRQLLLILSDNHLSGIKLCKERERETEEEEYLDLFSTKEKSKRIVLCNHRSKIDDEINN